MLYRSILKRRASLNTKTLGEGNLHTPETKFHLKTQVVSLLGDFVLGDSWSHSPQERFGFLIPQKDMIWLLSHRPPKNKSPGKLRWTPLSSEGLMTHIHTIIVRFCPIVDHFAASKRSFDTEIILYKQDKVTTRSFLIQLFPKQRLTCSKQSSRFTLQWLITFIQGNSIKTISSLV